MKYEKPYILTGVYQKHRDESLRITFVNIRPFVPGKMAGEVMRLCDHVNIRMDDLMQSCPEYASILENGKRYFLICLSQPYRDKDNTRRCSIKLTRIADTVPIIPCDETLTWPTEHEDVLSQVVDWNDFMEGRWIRREESIYFYSRPKIVQDNAHHKTRLKKENERERKKKKRGNSIWKVLHTKVS
jgi:hypothetical protein